MDEIELMVGNKKIKLVIEQRKWCRVYYINEELTIKLGADIYEVIISKLLLAFDTNNNRKYVLYKGMEIFTVLCLMEPHTAIVGKELNDSGIELFCIEDGGNIIPLITLSENDIKRWMEQLKCVIEEYSKG